MYYLLFYVLILIIPLFAQWYIKHNYSKYSEVKIKKGLSGFEVARKILDANGLEKMDIVSTPGTLTDHYDPSRKVVRLSKDTKARLEKLAQATGRSKAFLANDAIEKYLDMEAWQISARCLRLTLTYIWLIIRRIMTWTRSLRPALTKIPSSSSSS